MRQILFISLIITVGISKTWALTNAEAMAQLTAAGITVHSSGNCHDKDNAHCTSLDGVQAATINGIIAFKQESGCAVTITGGTETGHAGGSCSHGNGYKLDIALNSCVDSHIEKWPKVHTRTDCMSQNKSPSGFVFCSETGKNHWDITFC
jgi:hypothetical protein